MKIIDVSAKTFVYETNQVKDSDGHSHPGPAHQSKMALFTITTDEGVTGQTAVSTRDAREDRQLRAQVLVGQNPLRAEKLWHGLSNWQRGSGFDADRPHPGARRPGAVGSRRQRTRPAGLQADRRLPRQDAWPTARRCAATRSTAASPRPRTTRASPSGCVNARGYKAREAAHLDAAGPWRARSRLDIHACAAVREAVGPDIPLMLDANHWYSRTEALWLGRAARGARLPWFEEPMEEASISSYVAWQARSSTSR